MQAASFPAPYPKRSIQAEPIFRQWSLMPDRFDRRGGPISTSFGSWAFVVLVFTAIIFILALAVHEYSHMEMVRAVW
jgi:hypothetical protein